MGRGHLHNILFVHRTEQMSGQSLLQLEAGSMGKGNRWGTGVLIQTPKQGCLGELNLLQPKKNEKMRNSMGRPESSGMEGGGKFRTWGAV